MQFYFFSLTAERVCCRKNVKQYKLAGLVPGVADGLDGGLFVCKHEELGFEPQMVFCGPRS